MQDGRLASSYASDSCDLLKTGRSACHHEFDVFQLDHYINMKEAIAAGNNVRVRELRESMHGLPLRELDTCPLLRDSSKLQMIRQYRHLMLICVDHHREDIACWLLEHGCDYAIHDNTVIAGLLMRPEHSETNAKTETRECETETETKTVMRPRPTTTRPRPV